MRPLSFIALLNSNNNEKIWRIEERVALQARLKSESPEILPYLIILYNMKKNRNKNIQRTWPVGRENVMKCLILKYCKLDRLKNGKWKKATHKKI